MRLPQLTERGGGCDLGVAHEREDVERRVAALDPDLIELKEGEVGRLLRRVFADDDVDAVGARKALQPRGDIGAVADDRIVEALLRSHIADAGAPAVQPDAGAEN